MMLASEPRVEHYQYRAFKHPQNIQGMMTCADVGVEHYQVEAAKRLNENI